MNLIRVLVFATVSLSVAPVFAALHNYNASGCNPTTQSISGTRFSFLSNGIYNLGTSGDLRIVCPLHLLGGEYRTIQAHVVENNPNSDTSCSVRIANYFDPNGSTFFATRTTRENRNTNQTLAFSVRSLGDFGASTVADLACTIVPTVGGSSGNGDNWSRLTGYRVFTD